MADVLDAAELSLSDESCRIFTISSSLDQAKSFIDRVRSLGNVPLEESATGLPASKPTEPLMPVKIPWTISNKYYSADVHFAAHTVHGLSKHHLKRVPAVIFVWAQGEPYQQDIERIAQDLTGCEPEVCLAVKVAHLASYSADEDDSDTDAFLSSHGFEYVDAIEERSLQAFGLRQEEDYTGIPRIPRIIDALSTIMWPSMETKTHKASKNVQEKDRDFLDWARSSQDDRSSAIEEPLDRSDTTSLGSTRSRVREMQELARWLEEDNSIGDSDPWTTAASSIGISLSPADTDFEKREMPDSGLRFDDDFTIFVSAPAVDLDDGNYNNSEPPSPDKSTLVPPHGDLYLSLGSVSDFGGSDDGKRGNDVEDDDDDDLPTQEEIRATSSRIYGIAETTTEPDPGSPSGLRSAGSISPTFSFDSLHSELDRDSSYKMAPFDLSKVLGTLQEMKAEIGRMDDEGERRKAAARVALGLVYGLEE